MLISSDECTLVRFYLAAENVRILLVEAGLHGMTFKLNNECTVCGMEHQFNLKLTEAAFFFLLMYKISHPGTRQKAS